MLHQDSRNMFHGSLLFLIGFGAAITRCLADESQEIRAIEICARRFNLSEEDAGLLMFITVGADDYEVVAEQQNKCLVDCIARESGFLNANDEFNYSQFHGEVMPYCARTVENWDLWDRTNECQKGYLFLKCKSYGEELFSKYMDIQRKIASGELKPRGTKEDREGEPSAALPHVSHTNSIDRI